ncbi:NAD(P)-dependent oxidoreductase [Streptomyces sp. NPDC057336]|uniref:NAD(P)-dependent oxidoreductase n=1 Tax=Streptomyces sp. NPDC057336 TaxID=3346102 RepID=UPI00363704B9
MTAGERVVVVGAGVAGLTTAVVLAEAGAALHVIAEQVPRGARCRPGPPLVECADRAGRSRAPSASLRDGLRPPLTVRPAPPLDLAGYRAAPPLWHPSAGQVAPDVMASLGVTQY